MSENLFLLIKSLSKQEKRYFRLFATTHRKASNYIRLFDTISKQEKYDEAEIKETFSGEKFIKQLHVTKNYLYNLILKSLHSYHANISVDSKLKELLHYVEILYRKGFYNQCRKILVKTNKLAAMYEKHLVIIEIIEWQSKIAYIETKVKELEKYVREGYAKELETIGILRNEYGFRKLFYEILILNNKGTPVRNNNELNKYESIIDNPLLNSEFNAVSYYSKIMYYYIYSFYFFNIGDIVNSNKYNKKIVRLMEININQIKENPINYVAALNNLAYASTQLKEYNESINAIKKLRSIPEKYSLTRDLTTDLKEKIFVRSYFLELNLYIEQGQFDKGVQLIPEIQHRINLLDDKTVSRYKLFLYYSIAYIYFGVEDFSNALHWINKIINITEAKEPVDIFCFARILNLLIHYELENIDIIEYLYNSNIRYFNKKNRLYKFEKFIFHFIKNKLLKITPLQELNKEFVKLKNDLLIILSSSQNEKALQYFDFISWIDSKIENKSFAEVVRDA